MVISSLVVETTPGKVNTAASEIARIPGVEVHNDEGYKIVVTIEADTVDASKSVADGFLNVDGVTAINLIYVNFEDDPTICGPVAAGHGKASRGVRA